MFSNPSEENPNNTPNSNYDKRADSQVRERLNDFLISQHDGYREVHDASLTRAFTNRVRVIYGLDRYDFGPLEARVETVYECGDGALVALTRVWDDMGATLYPDARHQVLLDYVIHQERPGVILESLTNPSQIILMAPEGDPRMASLLPILSDEAFLELDSHRSSAILRLKAARSHDETSAYPVSQPSILVHLMLRTVREALDKEIPRGQDHRELFALPLLIHDIDQIERGKYQLRIARLINEPYRGLAPRSLDEIHTISLSFNRFYGRIEREWLDVAKAG